MADIKWGKYTPAQQEAVAAAIESTKLLSAEYQKASQELAKFKAIQAGLGPHFTGASKAAIALENSLKVLDARYKTLYTSQKSVTKESSGFEVAAKGLGALFGAGASSVTSSISNYAEKLSNVAFQTKEIRDVTGDTHKVMTMFGSTMGGNAESLKKWSGYAAVAATIAGSIADKVNEASIAQGKLSGLYGAKALTTTGSAYKMLAAGLEAGGSMGEESVKQMATTLYTGRRGLVEMLGASDSPEYNSNIARIVGMQAAGLPVAQFTDFAANTMGEVSGKKIRGQGERIVSESQYAGIPTELYAKAVTDLAGKFVTLGMTLDQAHESVRTFMDDVSKGTMSPALASSLLATGGEEKRTAGGVNQTLMNANWVGKNFSSLPGDLQTKLKGFQGADIMTQGSMLSALSEADYMRATRLGSLSQVDTMSKGLGSQAPIFRRLIAPQVSGSEIGTLESVRNAEAVNGESDNPLRKGSLRVLAIDENLQKDALAASMAQNQAASKEQVRWYQQYFSAPWKKAWGAGTDMILGEGNSTSMMDVVAAGVSAPLLLPAAAVGAVVQRVTIPLQAGTVNIDVSAQDKSATTPTKGKSTKAP